MVAAEKGQRGVVQRLHPHRQPVDPGVGEGGEAGRFRVGRIGLERDLDLAMRREQGAGSGDDGGDGLRLVEPTGRERAR
jgi:hypothetical protein